MENVSSRLCLSRFFILFAVSVALTLTFAAAADAQADTSDPLAGEAAEFVDTDSDNKADQITVAVANCQAATDATLIAKDPAGDKRAIDSGDATFTGDETQLTIDATPTNLIGEPGPGTGEIVSSTGFTCTDTADAARQNQAEDQFDCESFGSQESAQATLDADPDDPNNLDPDGNGRACDDFDFGVDANQQNGNNDGQSNADKQYGEETVVIVKKTVVKGALPDTGGPSPLLIPWALALVAAGITVLRRT